MLARSGKAGFDADRLARIDAFVKERYLDSGKLPHAQLLIARDGEIAHFSHQGAAREGDSTPVDESSLFRIASMTKPITSIGFMMLVEQGKVAVDTPVAEVLPEFKDIGVYNGGGGYTSAGEVPFFTKAPNRPMLMLDLLRHTSGLTYSFQHRSNMDTSYRLRGLEKWHDHLDLDGLVAELGKIPLEFSPGEAWNYSLSTDVLGAVIQRVSGQPLDVYLEENVFTPLGMHDTFFTVPADKVHRLTDCYNFTPGKGRTMMDRGAESAWSKKPTQISGGGGLVSTAKDYHRFCMMCINGGELDGARIVSRKTLDLMTRNHLPDGGDLSAWSKSLFSEASNAGAGFGLGFAVTIDVARSMIPGTEGDYYWGGMFSTFFFIDPVEKLHMVFMTQLGPSSTYPIRRELRTLIYSALT